MDPTEDPTVPYKLSLASAFYTQEDLQDELLPSLVYAQSELVESRLFPNMPSIQAPPSSWDLEEFGYMYDAPSVDKDGRMEGAQQPPDYYAYSPTHPDIWEDGAQAIEDFDWTAPGEDLEYFETTRAITVEPRIAFEDEQPVQPDNANYHQDVADNEIAQTPPAQVEEHQPYMTKDLEGETLPLQRATLMPWIPSPPTSRTIDPSTATVTVPIDIEETATSAEVEDNSVLLREAKPVLTHSEPAASSFPVTSDEQADEMKADNSLSLTIIVTPDAAIPEQADPRDSTESSVTHDDARVTGGNQSWDTQLQQAAANDTLDGFTEEGAGIEHEKSTQGATATNDPEARASDAEPAVRNDMRDTIEPMSNGSIDHDNDEDEIYETASDSTPQPAPSLPNIPNIVKSKESDIDTPEALDDVSPSTELTSEALMPPPVIEAHTATEEQPATTKDHKVEQVVTDGRKRIRSTKANAASDAEGETPVKKTKTSGSKESKAVNLKHVEEEFKQLKTESPIAQLSRLTATKSPKELTKKPWKGFLKQDKKESDVIEVKQKKKPTCKSSNQNPTLKQTDTDSKDETQPANDSSTMGLYREAEVVEAPTHSHYYDMQERLTNAHPTPTPSQSGSAMTNRPLKNHVSNRELAALDSSLAPGMHLGLHLQPAGRARQSRDGTPVRGNRPSINYNEDNIVLLDNDDEDEPEPEVLHVKKKKKRPASTGKRMSGAKRAKIEAPKTRAVHPSPRRSKAADEDDNDEDSDNLFPEPKLDTPTTKQPPRPKRTSTVGPAEPSLEASKTHHDTTPKPKTPLPKNKFGFSPIKSRTATRASAKKLAEEENIGKRLRSKD